MACVRRFQPDDERPLAEVFAQAFRDNPLNRAVIGGGPRRRLRSNRAGMRATLAASRRAGAIWVASTSTASPVGGLIAVPPNAGPFGPPPLMEQLRVLIGQGPRVARRWAEVFDGLQAFRPPEDSYALGLLGVAPADQGKGIGARLVRRWLEDVDAVEAMAHVETDRLDLVPFYRRFGFEPFDSTTLFDVPICFLQRPAVGRPATSLRPE